MIENESKDRRYKRTKYVIRRAFEELISEKDVNDITITEIVSVANINRKTFYAHYDGKYKLIEEIENEITDEFDLAISETDLVNDPYGIYNVFRIMTDIVNKNIDFYAGLLGSGHNSVLRDKLIDMLKQRVKASISSKSDIEDTRLDIALDYVLAGTIEVYGKWFKHGKNMSIEQLSEIVKKITEFGVNGLLSHEA